MECKAHDEHDCHYEPNRHREDGSLVLPELAFACFARFVKEQRCDEEHQEQFGIDRDLDEMRRNDGNHEPDGDLDEWERNARDHLVEHRRGDNAGEQYQNKFENLHVGHFAVRFAIRCLS